VKAGRSALQKLATHFPILEWGRHYDRATLLCDLTAAVIVTIMLVPQSLAYATLAGLPPEAGLYASVAPLFIYALLGSSRVLAVGPVAVVSLMTAAAATAHAKIGTPDYWHVALTLAMLSGMVSLGMGVLRLGFVARFISPAVVSGFITASAVLIAWSQIKVILGVSAQDRPVEARSLEHLAEQGRLTSLLIGLLTLAFLVWTRYRLKPLLMRVGVGLQVSDLMARAGPVVAVIVTACLTWKLEWHSRGLTVVGDVPQGLPPVTWPGWEPALWAELTVPALLIGLVGFVESVSVGQTLAARRGQSIDFDRELVALGASNLGAAFTSGLPVTGGLARSVVNFDAGARTPAAGALTAIGIMLTALWFTPALFHVPRATLAATIIVAVLSLIDLHVLKQTWVHSRGDFSLMALTILVTVAVGVEAGLITGALVALFIHLHLTTRPHIAEVGWLPGTQHFLNVLRHDVLVSPRLLCLRVDESLYFANAKVVSDRVLLEVSRRPEIQDVVLMFSAVNHVDASATACLEALDARLHCAGKLLHFSEIKGPVMDRMSRAGAFARLRGRVFMTHFDAVQHLAPELISAPPGEGLSVRDA